MPAESQRKTDFLVLGATVAGLRAAVQLAGAGGVWVLGKGDFGSGGSRCAQAGMAAAEDDELTLRLHDTLRAGEGLCQEEAVRILIEEGPRRIQELIEWDNRFDRGGTKLAFSSERGDSRSRVLRVQGESTGSEVFRALRARARSLPNLRLECHTLPVDLLVEDGRVCGVMYVDEKTSTFKRIRARTVLIATGGFGQVFKETTNPPAATGDGLAMACRAGALLSDLEFVAFHPTTLHVPGAPPLPMPEALRSEGACLRNLELQRFMPRYHEAAELAPRDVVSRVIAMEMQKSQSRFVYLDLTRLDPTRVKQRFPRLSEACFRYNVDITTDLIPVQPAAHFAIGGIATDLSGATTLPGLYAAGEAASTGIHGANYLPGNSLLEDLVFGARAALAMIEGRAPLRPPAPPGSSTAGTPTGEHRGSGRHAPAVFDVETALGAARVLMWEQVGVIRRGRELREAVRWLESVSTGNTECSSPKDYEQRTLLEVARLIARCALAREESRGVHYRVDFPLRQDTNPPRHSFTGRDLPVYFA